MTTPSRILLIAGMHRSGTSAVAGWLHRCGLDLGEEFVEPTYGNPRGHFEDLDFVGFHKRVLEAQGLDFVLSPDQAIRLGPDHIRQAYALLREKPGRLQWGFKDPRTSLFLDFWRARLVEPKLLALYRPWPAVVDSLMRRDLKQPATGLKKSLLPVWHSASNRWLANRYLGTWIRYNEALAAYGEAHADDTLFVPTEGFPEAGRAVWDHLTGDWDFHLSVVGLETVWRPEDLRRDVPEPKVSAKLRARAESVWQRLEALTAPGLLEKARETLPRTADS